MKTEDHATSATPENGSTCPQRPHPHPLPEGEGNEDEGERNAGSAVRCHAHNRKGARCGRLAAPGKRVCHYHGGAPGSGAPKGNQNRFVHGFYARKYRNISALAQTTGTGVRDRARELLNVSGLSEEIANVRVLVRDAIDAGRSLEQIAAGLEVLTRMVRAEHELSPRSKDAITEAIAEALERLGDQMGLKEFNT